MSELFNQRSSVEGKIPSGLFNACFDLDSGAWAQDAAATKCLAMDGYFISLFDLRLDRRPLALADRVLRDAPAAWDPAAIARFIDKYGTHVVVGLSVGGQDVVYVKQDGSSALPPAEIKEHLDRLGDQLFTGACAMPPLRCKSKDKLKMPEAFNVFDAQLVAQQRLQAAGMITTLVSSKEGVTVIYSKRGGDTTAGSHSEWLLTVPATPDVISIEAVPITSLLKGVPGAGYLSHAINLYLRCKYNLSDPSVSIECLVVLSCITRCGRRRSASCPSARAPTGSRAPARRFISARSVPSSMSAQHRRLSLSCRSLGCGCTWRARNTTG
uniref:MACPF domain-containing protein n=1 Tax=Zea mays TaxID=4577 RepID=A0A804PP63_MAIZE